MEKSLKSAVEGIKQALGSWRPRIDSRVSVFPDGEDSALLDHLKFVESWSRQISLKDLPRSRLLSDVFIKLSLSERPTQEGPKLIDPSHLLGSGLNSVLLGHPGAGKTTVIKYLCQKILRNVEDKEGGPLFPLLVLLRDLRGGEGIADYLLRILRVRIVFYRKVDNEIEDEKYGILASDGVGSSDAERELYEQEERECLVAWLLNESRALLLLDGLDEMRPADVLRVQGEILRFANLLASSKFVLTCRIGALEVAIANSEVLYACPFNEQQVYGFTKQWLESEAEARDFLAAVERSPYRDTIGRPLILVNLCMVYQAYGELPEQPMLVYQKVIQLLLEQWDRQRDLRRASRYGRFGPDRKRQFLGALAYELSTNSRAGTKYGDGELRSAFRRIHSNFSLPLEERDLVLDEIESHTGLFLRTSLGRFEFSHKSLQEYLCADHISRLPNLHPELRKLIQLPNECAITTVLSASPNGLLEFLAFNFIRSTAIPLKDNEQIAGFWVPYLTRLQIEGASFAESPLLGLALLLIASLAHLNVGGGTLMGRLSDLLDQQAVRNSVREAGSAYSVVTSSGGYIELQVKSDRKNSLPKGMPGTIRVDRRYLEKAGTLGE